MRSQTDEPKTETPAPVAAPEPEKKPPTLEERVEALEKKIAPLVGE